MLLLFYLVATLLHLGAAQTLRDLPILASGPPLYLDGPSWVATEVALGLTLPATVPGDVITDLQRAGVVGDPWYELNWLDNRTLWSPNSTAWVFSTNVALPPPGAPLGSSLLLVLEGIKMGAHISLNGAPLGIATNQHVRYVFPIPEWKVGANRLEVAFDAELQTKGRYMACTGGWDWAPMSHLSITDTEFGVLNAMSLGIWKSVYVAAVAPSGPPAITSLTPLLRYLGPYPVGRLADGAHGGFSVNVTAHVWASAGGATGALTVAGEWGASATAPLTAFPPGESVVTLTLPASATQMKLWWPNGLGSQPLFNVTASWGGGGAAETVRRIGFRVAALVTVNDTNATVVAESEGVNGNGVFGMFFRVNGAALYARGGNVVPMEELEGRLDAQGYATLVRSAADANMNILRVWGGGIYPPDVFYDTCDERGVLLYHDLQFARGNFPQPLSAEATASVLAEVSHQARRLSHHPSLILYDSNNEDVVQGSGPTALYATLLMTAVASEDASRILWPNSPSAGWRSGVHRLYGTPNGQPLVALGGGHAWSAGNEDHRIYTAGVGAWNWTTCMFDPWTQAHTFDPALPPSLAAPGARGPAQPSVFVSEFGSSSMSSFESMSGTLAPDSWGLHGGNKPSTCTKPLPPGSLPYAPCTGRNAMAQRNWAADNLVWSYFGPSLLNASGEVGFKGGLFQSMVAAALNMQSVVEAHRSGNYLGAIEWQLNEVWPTGGWGSLEYGSSASPGSLRGGRWKPMHYWFKNHIFADVMAACGLYARRFTCFVSNARSGVAFSGTLTLTAVELATGVSSVWAVLPMSAAPGPGAVSWATPNATLPNASTALLVATLLEDGVGMAPFDEHVVHLTAPVNLRVTRAFVTATPATKPNADGSVDITVTSDAVALFVTLTAMAPGRFSDNAFLLLPAAPRTVVWTPFVVGDAAADYALVKASLRVEDHSAYAV